MPEVAEAEAPESQADDTSEESVETPATPAFDEATWKKRVAGKDQALTEAKKQAAELKKQLDDLSRWKAEKEQADMSELDKALKRIADAEARAAAAEAAANAARLAREYPLAAGLLGDDIGLFSAERVAEIDGNLKKAAGDESAPEPRIDPNNPRRQASKPPASDLESLKKSLADLGNPFFDPDAS